MATSVITILLTPGPDVEHVVSALWQVTLIALVSVVLDRNGRSSGVTGHRKGRTVGAESPERVARSDSHGALLERALHYRAYRRVGFLSITG
jgi:hypothetical protein